MSETFSFDAWMARRRRMLDLTQRELAAHTNCALALFGGATAMRIQANSQADLWAASQSE